MLVLLRSGLGWGCRPCADPLCFGTFLDLREEFVTMPTVHKEARIFFWVWRTLGGILLTDPALQCFFPAPWPSPEAPARTALIITLWTRNFFGTGGPGFPLLFSIFYLHWTHGRGISIPRSSETFVCSSSHPTRSCTSPIQRRIDLFTYEGFGEPINHGTATCGVISCSERGAQLYGSLV